MKGGKKRSVLVNIRLASKPSGCVVWFDYNPSTLALGPFRWFGTLPELGLPDLGEEVARHTKGDSTGSKNERPGHRVLRRSKFTQVDTIADLVPLLFGYDIHDEVPLLRNSISEPPDSGAPEWVGEIYAGGLDAVPSDLQWKDSVHFAHLVDGYKLCGNLGLGDPLEFEARQLAQATETGRWAGGPAVLWTTLFLEQRRWCQASPATPDPETELLLDRLCRQLVSRLKSALRSAP